MKEYAKALRTLHTSIDLSDCLSSLMKLSAIETFCKQLHTALGVPDAHHKAGYVQDKLGLFRSYCYYAITPELGMGHKTPSEWLTEAGYNLTTVEGELS